MMTVCEDGVSKEDSLPQRSFHGAWGDPRPLDVHSVDMFDRNQF